MLSTNSSNLIQSYLQRDPLRHVVLQKLLRAHMLVADVRYTEVEAQPAVLILIPSAASAWDVAHYPEIDTIALMAADQALAADRLLADLPIARYVFKIAGTLERDAILRRLPAQRTTAFISYTADQNRQYAQHPYVRMTAEPDPQVLAFFTEQGHSAAELLRACHAGEGFVPTVAIEGRIAACCFATAIGDRLWEIGGLFTQPDQRRRGLALALVETALGELARRGVLARYQVHERNRASQQLAEAVGLRQCVVVEHWLGAVRAIEPG